MPRDRFEVVVVHGGDDPDLLDAVAALRSQHPRLNLRTLEAREPGAGHARNVGIAAARGDYLTFVDADDRVAPRYLEALLEEADPGIVVVAIVADADRRSPVDAVLRHVAGRTLLASELPGAFGDHTAKLVSTVLARSARFDPTLSSGESHAYWLALFAHQQFRFRVLRAGDGAAYRRRTRQRQSR